LHENSSVSLANGFLKPGKTGSSRSPYPETPHEHGLNADEPLCGEIPVRYKNAIGCFCFKYNNIFNSYLYLQQEFGNPFLG
jgi:hypothetical protein